jgi:hypothetical protein
MEQTTRCWTAIYGCMTGPITTLLMLGSFAVVSPVPVVANPQDKTMLIDDFSRPGLVSALDTAWRGVSDRVMGGVSREYVSRSTEDGRPSLHLQGDVRLKFLSLTRHWFSCRCRGASLSHLSRHPDRGRHA